MKLPKLKRQSRIDYYHDQSHIYIDDIKELEQLRQEAENRGDMKALAEYQLHLQGARKVLKFIYEELGVDEL